MFGTKTKRKTGNDIFAVLLIAIPQLSRLANGVDPARLLDLIRRHVQNCEDALRSVNGRIVRSDGDCILAVISSSDTVHSDSADMSGCGLAVLETAKKTRRWALENGFKDFAISVTMSQGECVFEKVGDEYTHLFGSPLNRVQALLNRFGQEGGLLVIDESLRATCRTDCQTVGDGAYKLNTVGTDAV